MNKTVACLTSCSVLLTEGYEHCYSGQPILHLFPQCSAVCYLRTTNAHALNSYIIIFVPPLHVLTYDTVCMMDLHGAKDRLLI